jgi:rubrerythrin
MAEEGSSLYLCPHCGAFVSEIASKCPNCGMDLEKPEEEELDLHLDDMIKDDDKEESDKVGAEVSADLQDLEKAVAIFLCSECGAFTSENEKTCPNCGASLVAEPEAHAGKTEGKKLTPEQERERAEKDRIFDMLVTKSHGEEELTKEDEILADMLKDISKPEDVVSFVDSIKEAEAKKDEEIHKTGEESDELGPTGNEPEAEIGLEDLIIGEKLKADEGDKEEALAHMKDTSKTKPASSDELIPKSEDIESALDDLIIEEKKKTDAIVSLETRLKAEPEPKPEPEYGDFVLCNECGAFVLPGQKKCGICGAGLEAGKLVKPGRLKGPTDERPAQVGAAQDTLRKILGILDSTEVKPVEEFASGGKLNMCTICGAFLAEGAEKCTICGTMVEDMPEFVASPVGREQREIKLAICPGCGAFLNEGARSCTVCNREFPKGLILEKIEPEKVVEMATEEKAEDVLRKALGVIELKDTEPTEPAYQDGAIDLCPECGAFVSPTAIKCGICGAALVEGGDMDADLEILDLENAIEDLASIECPNCGSNVSVGSSECPLCGLAFETGRAVAEDLEKLAEPEDKKGEDISGLLEKEFPLIPGGTEKREEPEGEKLEDISLEPQKDVDELLDMLVPVEEGLKEDEQKPPVSFAEGPPKGEYKKSFELKIDKDIDEIVDMLVPLEALEHEGPTPGELEEASVPAEAPLAKAEPELAGDTLDAIPTPGPAAVPLEAKPESLVWDEDRITTIAKDTEKELKIQEMEERAPETAEVAEEEIPDWEPPNLSELEDRPARREPETLRTPANWEYGVYASAAAVLLFSIFYVLAPGDYSISLALIFGVLCGAGVYMAFTEKGTFVKSDLKKASIFLTGCFIVSFIALHWPAGVLTGNTGALGQPGLDRTLLSIGILLIGVGIIWMRSRIRYVLTWFSGTVFLFISSLVYAQGDWSAGAIPSALLVAGTGAGLAFASLGFLTYERAIKTSIETDIVRGDADYMKKDFNRALASYESALTKVQSRQVVNLPTSRQAQYDVPWYSKGSALILMGKLEEGIKCLEMALAINPNNEVAWVNKGNAHSKLGEQKSAMECYKKAVELNPSYEIAWNNLGNVLARGRRYVDALRCYNTAIKLNPRYEDVWINKCYVLVKMGRQDQAMKCINRGRIKPVHKIPGTSPPMRAPIVLV